MTTEYHYPYQIQQLLADLERQVAELKKELEFLLGKDHERDTKEARNGSK